jgi:hypothetical protein
MQVPHVLIRTWQCCSSVKVTWTSEQWQLESYKMHWRTRLFRRTHEHELSTDMKKVKVKLSLYFSLTQHHAIKAYWGSGGIAPHILDLRTRWRWVVSFMLRLLYPQGMGPWYPLHRRLGGPHCWPGHGGEEKNSHPLPGLEAPIIQPVPQSYTNEQSRFLIC